MRTGVVDRAMGSDPCDCCQPEEATADDETVSHWLGAQQPLEQALPRPMQTALGDLVGADRIETLAAWCTAVGDWVDGDGMGFDDLCHADAATDHRGRVGADTFDFYCFLDAVILAAFVDEPVEIETTNPRETTVTLHVDGTDILSVDPDSAVFSFGIDPAIATEDGDTAGEEVGYRSICPYVHAFSTRAEYFAWAVTHPVPTVGMPISVAPVFADAVTP